MAPKDGEENAAGIHSLACLGAPQDHNMEKEPRLTRQKPTAAAAIDYPEVAEIMVSFPDKWELIHKMQREEIPLYIAAIPIDDEPPRPDEPLQPVVTTASQPTLLW